MTALPSPPSRRRPLTRAAAATSALASLPSATSLIPMVLLWCLFSSSRHPPCGCRFFLGCAAVVAAQGAAASTTSATASSATAVPATPEDDNGVIAEETKREGECDIVDDPPSSSPSLLPSSVCGSVERVGNDDHVTTTAANNMEKTKAIIERYLLATAASSAASSASSTVSTSSTFDAAVKSNDVDHLRTLLRTQRFHVHGWRWHAMSVMRECTRLQRYASRRLKGLHDEQVLAQDHNDHQDQDRNQDNVEQGAGADHHQKEDDDKLHLLEKAVSYVIEFNMGGLHKVENELFVPWLREKLLLNPLPSSSSSAAAVEAFRIMLDDIDADRIRCAKLGEEITKSATIASSPATSLTTKHQAVQHLIKLSTTLTNLIRSILHREDSHIVPAIALLVPKRDQDKFNTKVLLKLGVLDSRLHLVGMHDAVYDDDNVYYHGDNDAKYGNATEERDLYERSLPFVMKTMVNRWRRTLYEPRGGMLDDDD